MASNTPNLNLLKKDPVVDGSDTFNIQTMLNDNWDKIDQAIGDVREELQDIDVPPASLTEAGIVRLSNSTSGTREDVAATELAVKTTYDAAAAAQTTANAANLAAAAAQAKADAAETPSGAQAKVNAAVGNLASLQTTAKGNAVAAINELFTSASNGKTQIAAAITGKGVPASGSDTFAQLATKIGQISTLSKLASGSIPVSEIDTPFTISASGLGFAPRMLVLRFSMNVYANIFKGVVFLMSNGTKWEPYASTSSQPVPFTFTASNIAFLSNGFSLTGAIEGPNSFGSIIVDWIAIE